MSATSIDVGREHIEHYGVLGMRWGVRRDLDGSDPAKKKMSLVKKAAIGTGLAAVTAAGVLVTAKFIVTRGNLPLAQMRDNTTQLNMARDRVQQIMSSSRSVDVNLARSHPDVVLRMAQQRVANLTR